MVCRNLSTVTVLKSMSSIGAISALAQTNSQLYSKLGRLGEFNEHHQLYSQRLLAETLQERCIINQREMNTRSTFVRKGFYSILGIIEKVQEKQSNTTALQKTSFSRRVMREPGDKFG